MSWIGCVDTLSDTVICGWAANDEAFDREVQVDVIANSRRVATLPCVEFRDDLRAAGIGGGCKGFTFNPGAYLKPGRNDLQVRYAGTDVLVSKGQGCWVKRREGVTSWEQAFIAALEAYCEFRPEDHICGIGAWAGELERVLRKAQLPFRRFTRLEVSPAPADVRLPEKADIAICWAYAKPSPECARVVEALVQSNMNERGLLAFGFADTPASSRKIKAAFTEYAPLVKYESLAMAPNGARRMFAFAQAGAAKQSGNAGPVLVHIHVPKCAGTSFRVLLQRYLGPRHVPLYVDDTYFVYGEETLRNYLLQDPEILGFSSHHVRSFPRWVAGRRMLYVTFLRDPVEQFVSYMTHFKKLFLEITSRSLLEAVPPDVPQLTLREFARWLLTQNRDIPFRENHNVNFLARHSSPAEPDRLAAAKAALEEFFFVGISERMEESVHRLRTKAQAAGLNFPPDPVPVENTSCEYRDDVGWIHSGDEVGWLLLRSVEKDRQLYEWALARFNAS
jgi:hypothetical protein